MSLQVKYLDYPEGAQQAAELSGSTGQAFSSLPRVLLGAEDIPYATLEPGQWALDGSRTLLADSPAGMGWWSSRPSDETGRFAQPPTLVLLLPEPYTATGLTFTFSPATGQWCSELRVRWYNGQTLLAETTAFPTAGHWVLAQKVESFTQCTVELLATNHPGQFAKLQQLFIGQETHFGRDELVEVRLTAEVDHTLCKLPVDTLQVELHDRAGRAFAPQENQRMEVWRNGELLAAHYITESSRRAANHYVFSCQSAVGLLEDDFLGGLYAELPAEALLDDILNGRSYTLDAAFAGQKITGYLPVCSRREALQQVAFALGAMVTTQGSDAICLLPLPEHISHVFSHSATFTGAKMETAPRVARVEVAAHSYAPANEVETLLNEEPVSGSDLLFTFADPHHSYSITGGTVTGSGVNWVTLTANGTVTLTGKAYAHGTVVHTRRNPAATAAERGNVLTVSEATLVHAGNVQNALDRLYTASQYRQTLQQDAVVSGHRAGQKAAAVTPWGSQSRGYITAMESSLTANGHTAAVTLVGVEVAPQSVFRYAGEIFAGEKEVIY